jgi:hypothetical protein
MFLPEISESFVRELLEVPHAVSAQQIHGCPGLVNELHPLAWHETRPFSC